MMTTKGSLDTDTEDPLLLWASGCRLAPKAVVCSSPEMGAYWFRLKV
jgi:hypothetical protein